MAAGKLFHRYFEVSTSILLLITLYPSPVLSGTTPYVIGVQANVDYGFWKQVRRTTTSNAETMHEIKYYFAHLFKEINDLFSTLRQDDLEMSVVLQDLKIDPEGSARWSAANYIAEPENDLIDLDHAREDLTNQSGIMGNNYDIVMGFTGYKLSTSSGIGMQHGVSVGKGACTNGSNVIIVEDEYNYVSAITAAHEIAHSLGALDHNLTALCANISTSIMLDSIILRADLRGEAFTKFSNCTAEEIRRAMKEKMKGHNCLEDATPAYFNPKQMSEFMATLPGQRKQFDEQCQIAFGIKSYYCPVLSRNEVPCSYMSCFSKGECRTVIQTRPFDGTSCGEKKWCQRGQCIKSKKALPFDKVCPFGDSKLFTGCSGANINRYCYDESKRMKCCKTCALLKNTLRLGCEYGDHLPTCRITITGDLCYLRNNNRMCCDTCLQIAKDFKESPASCKYGDTLSPGSCKTRRCYLNKKHCCGTCTYGEGYPYSEAIWQSSAPVKCQLLWIVVLTLKLII